MTIASDCISAWRSLRRRGGLFAVVVLMLAVAIGAVTAIFSIAHAVLLRPLPVTDPDRVVLLWGRDDSRSNSVVEVSLADQRAWRAGQKSFSAIEIFGSVNWGELHVTAPGEPFRAVKNAVSAGFFDVLGARPMLGRAFRLEDDLPNAAPTVVLSGDLWRRRFSSDPAVIGRILTVGAGRGASAFEVIGVMPPDFRIPAGAEVWIALGPELTASAKEQKWDVDGVRAMYALARLEDGATVESAVAQLSTIARSEELKQGLSDTSMVVVATPLTSHLLGPARPALLAIAGASAVLLLIACANAAGLLMVHGGARRREVAVRLALGARRWQIVRQLLTESIVLSLVAGAFGVVLAYLSFDAIVALAPIEVPRLQDATIDARALLFALAMCIATAVLIGLLPAWRHSALNLITGLQQRSQSGTTPHSSARARKVLVATQLAAAVVLLTAAGLFTRSFVQLLRLDLGFDPKNVLTFDISAPASRYDTKEKQWALVDAVLERARQTPKAHSAGAVFLRPFEHGVIGMDSSVVLQGQPLDAKGFSRNPIVNWEVATPDYFRAMDIGVLRGRVFDDRDTANAPPVVIVSQSLAGRLWPGHDAIGRRLLTYGAPGDEKNPGWQTVVGIVEDARYREVETPRFDLYLPYKQAPNPVEHFMLRVTGDPMTVVPELRAAVATIDPEVTVENVTTMEQIVGRAFAPWRFNAVVVSALSLMAVTFAAVGLAALVAYAVTQRTREIGVRVALGAQRRDVIALLIKESVWMTFGGLAAGMLTAWLLRRLVASMLFGVVPDDVATFGGVAVVLAVVSLLAAYLPARRAARIDPAVALRTE
jgi:putative ABC transport system permease protein